MAVDDIATGTAVVESRMSKQQGARGKRGAQGATGRVGKTGRKGLHGEAGSKGKHGLKGKTGARGSTGLKGATGSAGRRGHAGTPGQSRTLTIPSIVLTNLQKQIERIYTELEVQMKRMAQVQAELDQVREQVHRPA